MLKRIVGLVLLAVTIAGCNTIAGLGRDIDRGGEKLQGAAQDVQRSM